jgi:hypothetical protein
VIVVEFIKCLSVFILCQKTNHSTTVYYTVAILSVLFIGIARISYVMSLNTQHNSRTVGEVGLSVETFK